jgi:hypothetical protein
MRQTGSALRLCLLPGPITIPCRAVPLPEPGTLHWLDIVESKWPPVAKNVTLISLPA